MSIDWKCAKKFKFNVTIPENEKKLNITMKRKGNQKMENGKHFNNSTFQLNKSDIDMG